MQRVDLVDVRAGAKQFWRMQDVRVCVRKRTLAIIVGGGGVKEFRLCARSEGAIGVRANLMHMQRKAIRFISSAASASKAYALREDIKLYALTFPPRSNASDFPPSVV